MVKVSATDFIKSFGRYNRAAQSEPLAVTSHGRTVGYFISAEEYEAYQALRASLRRHYTAETLPDDLYAAIMEAQVEPRFEALNRLLDQSAAKE